MVPRVPISRRLLLLGFYIAGTVAGIIFLTPGNNGDKLLGGAAGFMCALLSSFLIFSELRNMLPKIWSGSNVYGFNMKNYFTHPIQKPMMLGFLWFIVFMALGIFTPAFEKFQSQDKPYLLLIFLSPSFFLFGLSGFLMIRRNEGINKFGQIHRGFWAYFNGVLGIIFGWGFLLLIVLAYAFKW